MLSLYAAVVLAMMTAGARADESHYEYTVDDEGNAAITAYTGPGGNVIIPKTLGGSPVRVVYGFAYNTNVTRVVIPDSAHIIKGPSTYSRNSQIYRTAGAFEACSALTNVVIGSAIKNIEAGSFHRCTSIKSLVIPDSVLVIYEAIEGQSSPYLIQYIPGAFEGCTGLERVKMGSGLTNLGSKTFFGCKKLSNLELGENLMEIGSEVFSGCVGLTNVIIPDSVAMIADQAFAGCSNMTTLVLGNGLLELGKGAFSGCAGLTNLVIPDNLAVIHGAKDMYNYYSFSYIPGVFEGCTGLRNVQFGSGLTSIGKKTFAGCTSLTNVTLPGSLTDFGESIFSGCTNLATVTLGSGITNISDGAFKELTGLRAVVFPDSLLSIGESAFAGCTKLVDIDLVDGIKEIGAGAFAGCIALTNVIFPDSLERLYDSRLGTPGYGWSAPGTPDIPGVFEGCTGLLGVTFGDNLVSIGSKAFAGCTNLNRIVFGDSLEQIGNNAFFGCTALTDVHIPNSVTNIGENAFRDCVRLASLVAPSGTVDVGINAFTGTILPFDLFVVADPVGGGNVLGAGRFIIGSTQTIAAVANPGYAFWGWNDDDVNATRSVVIPYGGASLTANFVLVPTRVMGMSGDLAFGNVVTGQTVSRTLTITNSGNSALNITNILYPDGFGGAWTGVVDPGAATNVTVVFAPAALASYGGAITIQGNQTGGTNTINCSGTGVKDSASITFNASPSVGGTISGGGTFPVGSTQTISAVASPGYSFVSWSDGNSNATRSVVVPEGGATFTASFALIPTRVMGLSGNMTFGNITVGESVQRTLRITNSGNSALTVTGINYPQGFSGAWSGVLAAGRATNVVVTFAPTQARSYSGTITVDADRTSGANTLECSGVGVASENGGWDAGSEDLNFNGWRRSSWFGDYVPMGEGWIYHNRHGFWFALPASTPDSIFYWSEDMGWLWTSSTTYTYLYRFDPPGWLYYEPNSTDQTNRWFLNMSNGNWFSIPLTP